MVSLSTDDEEDDEFSLAAAVADAKADPDDPEFRAGAAPTGDDTDRYYLQIECGLLRALKVTFE